ncbi:conjugal transfer protein [Thermobifida cellulosilytica]|uniref:Conjugal transfer protein n=1 Tax=Thermobifida cellulosilytica TB100 TaxID=665004 RepID=A0A147KGS9_THECS|nr:conjugal transfer protein [Thermobifida cellulosilytica]KUP96399.1 hypothetical protein AC529_12320 [Thermobifida cellulosilytica TB100]
MAGRSAAGRGGVIDEDAPAAAEEAFDSAPRRGGGRRPRAGAGGRWWLWVGRAVLWAFLIVVFLNGLWLPLRENFFPRTAQEPAAEDRVEFPETAAASLAVRFAEVYLNTSPDKAEERRAALAEFVPEGQSGAFDIPGAELSATGVEVLVVDVHDDNNALVRLAADVNGQPMTLDVPVYADQGGTALVVSGRPALLAAPDKATLPDRQFETDPQARSELEETIKNFFEAYAQNHEHLDRYLAPGADVTALPSGVLQFGSIVDLKVPVAGSGTAEDARAAQVTVVWLLPDEDGEDAAELTQSYSVTVVKDGSDWYVRDIRGALNSFG